MSYKFKSLKHVDGFTIIEVIIVLVIAAVIMLAVFLVVPQLQASQRNSRRQQSTRQVLSAVNQYIANNNGNLPTNATDIFNITGSLKDPSTTTFTISYGAAATAPAANNIIITQNAVCSTYTASQYVAPTSSPGHTAVTVWTEGAAPNAWCVND